MIITAITLFITVLCAVHVVFNYNKKARKIRSIPGPADFFILGNALEIPNSPVELFKTGRKFATKFNRLYRVWTFPVGFVNIYTPEDIEKILANSKHNSKSQIYKFLKPWLREGLLVSNGVKWQERRKVLTPAFHFNILRNFCEIFEESSNKLTKDLASKGDEFTVDLVPLISDFTLNSICETAMGTRLDDEAGNVGRRYKKAIYDLGRLLVDRFTKIYLYTDFVFNLTKMGQVQKQLLSIIHSFTKKVISDRKMFIAKNGIEPKEYNIDKALEDHLLFLNKRKHRLAMLDLLISAQKDGLIDDIGIQEEVDTFMFEDVALKFQGHDTTASGLVHCLMLLANHREIQVKVVNEIQRVKQQISSAGISTIEDLSKLKYLDCVVKESLRLFPPVPFISRSIDEDIYLGDYLVPAGTFCHIHIFDLHRRADLYQDPHIFNPDRFLAENTTGRHPYAYIPFSAGPRNCIGQRFAILEMKLAIVSILQKFELRPVTKYEDIEFLSDLVLRTSHPIYVSFVKRGQC